MALGTKVLGLTAFAAILFSVSLSIGVQTSYAQFEPSPSQQQEQQDAGEEPEVASDGGLTATLNGESFTRGDTIILSGTVEEREDGSTVYARIFDPDSIELDIEGIHVNTDGTFRHGFVAGEDSTNDGTSDPMTKSGTYTMTLEYLPPGITGTETTEVTFEYDAEAPPVVGGQDDSAPVAGAEPTTTFQNLTEGFRIGVPNGWVADDGDFADSVTEEFIATNGYNVLGFICPQENALPKVGGLYDCTSSVEGVVILAYPNLHTRPEFAPIINQNRNITVDDIIAYDIQQRRNLITNQEVASRMSIESQTDTTVNVLDPTTNQIVQTVPAREVVYGIPALFGDTIFVTYSLIVLADNGTSGYSISGLTEEDIELNDGMPTFVRQAFDSFELLTPSSRPNVTNSSSTQEQSQQQLVQSAGGLTARLNANNFTTGDTITVNGTVAERRGYSYVTITVVDPRGEYVLLEQPRVTADNTFTHSYVAGEQDEIMPEYRMVVSGNYLLQVSHGTDTVELTFAYEATGNMTGEIPIAATTTTPSPAQEEQPQQQQQSQPQNAGNSVSIPSGSSTLTTDAFSPNHIQVSAGSTVTWTNDDAQPHTVTSGENATPNQQFDSGIMAPAATFEYTFTEAGDNPYFCLLHPNMVGNVSVG